MKTLKVEGAEQLRRLAVELKVADAALLTQMRRDLRAEVTPIASEVKAQAATFSKTIPRTIGVRTQFAGRRVGVWIVASASRLPEGHKPLARLQELGSRRNRNVIRHPSRQGPQFSQEGPWVNQPTHPYLLPTVRRNETKVRLAMVKVMRETSRVAGFKP